MVGTTVLEDNNHMFNENEWYYHESLLKFIDCFVDNIIILSSFLLISINQIYMISN